MSEVNQGRDIAIEQATPPAEEQKKPGFGVQRFIGALLGGAVGGVAASLLLAGIIPAGVAFLAPVLGILAGAEIGSRVVNYVLSTRYAKEQETQLERDGHHHKEIHDDFAKYHEHEKELEKPKEAVPEMTPLRVTPATPTIGVPDPGHGLTRVVNGVEIPEYVYHQIGRRYDPNQLSREQLMTAARAAFVDGTVFDDDRAKYGFDDELHNDYHEHSHVSAGAHSVIKDIVARGPRHSHDKGHVAALEEERAQPQSHDKNMGDA